VTDSRKPDMNTHKIKHELQSLVQSYNDGETWKEEVSTWYTQGAYSGETEPTSIDKRILVDLQWQ